MTNDLPAHANEAEVQRAVERLRALQATLNNVLYGQEELIDQVIVCLLSHGHLLLEGLPGLGKTELVKALGHALNLDSRRIQFTPDLLPGDITGGASSSFNPGRSSPTSCSPMRSTAPRPRRSPPCWRPCRSGA